MPPMKQKHPHSALIDAIGAKIIRKRLNVGPMNIYTWRIRGIPHRYRPAFNSLAGQYAVVVPADFFEGMVL